MNIALPIIAICLLACYCIVHQYMSYEHNFQRRWGSKSSMITATKDVSLFQAYSIKTTYYQFISQCPPNVVNQMINAFKRSKSKEKARGLSSFNFEYRFRKSDNSHDYYVVASLNRCRLNTSWNPVGDTTFEDVLVVDDFSISNETI
jgi:hypothetical protein